MKKKPIFSVITLSYNTGPFVIQALECIKKQTIGIENIQHIIIDDCSKDESVKQIKEWIQSNSYSAQLICNFENIGVQNSLNIGLNLVKGEYLFMLNDDLLIPSGLETIAKVFNSTTEEFALIFTPANLLYEKENKIIQPSNNYIEKSIHQYVKPYKEIINNKISISAPAVFYRTDILKKINIFNNKYFIEDFPMLLTFAKSYNFLFYNEAIVTYRVHADSISQAKKRQVDESYIKVLIDEVRLNPKDRALMKDISYSIRYRIFMLSKYNKIRALIQLYNSSFAYSLIPNTFLGLCILFNINYLNIINRKK